MAKQRKAPPGTYWRNGILWGRILVKGREIRWSLRTDDVETARDRRKVRHDREIAASHYGDERKTWDDAVIAWAEHMAGNVGPATLKRYGVSLGMVESKLRGMYLDEIDKATMAELVRSRKKAGVTNATIRRDLVAVSSVLGFCEDEDWIDQNVAFARLRRLKERRDPIVLPEHEHIAYVVDRAPGLLATMIETALASGCRQAELAGLQRPRLDFTRKQIAIVGKGRKLRTIDMHGAYAILSRAPIHVRSKWVFWHDDGEPYRNVASRFLAIVKSAQKQAQRDRVEFRPFAFHHLRHRFAVDFLKNRVGGLYELRDHLGHSSVKTTEIYLAYLTPEEKAWAKGEAGTNSGTGATVSATVEAKEA